MYRAGKNGFRVCFSVEVVHAPVQAMLMSTSCKAQHVMHDQHVIE